MIKTWNNYGKSHPDSIPILYLPELVKFKSRLRNAANGLPRHMNLAYRHQLDDYNVFKMNPGYTNFQKIKKGEVLATENSKDVCAPMDGYILMPLYQKIGSDGFFIVKEN